MGCEVNPYTLAIEDEFTDKEVVLIDEAIQQWVYITDTDDAVIYTKTGYKSHHEFRLDEDWDNGPDYAVLHKIHRSDQGYLDFQVQGSDFKGKAMIGGNRIAIVAEFTEDPEIFYRVILHELGHFYGLHHTDIGIMLTGVLGNEHNCLSIGSLKEFCDLHDCGRNAASTCGI